MLDAACKTFLEDPDKPLLIWENADKYACPLAFVDHSLWGLGPPNPEP